MKSPCLLVLLFVLGGCATTGGQPGTTVPTTLKAGQSWVITRPVVAAQVLDTCSRDSPGRRPGEITDYWAPSRQQVDDLEARLSQLAPRISAPGDSDRQYVGIVVGGRRLIYVNAFTLPDDSDLDPARTAIRVCDGGAAFWGAVFDPETGQFSQVETNGQG